MLHNINKDSSILSAIVLSSDDAIISKDLDGTITSWNPAAEVIFGYSAAEMIGKNIRMIIPHELQKEEAAIIARMKQGEKIEHYETYRKRKDGSTFLAAITISPVKDDRGIVTGASKIVRDISGEKMSEEKQALLAAIIDSSDDAIVSKNLQGFITSWNKGAENIFGYTAPEVVGKHISIIIPKSRLAEETMILAKIHKGERINHIETVRVTKDGKEINVSLTISPIKDIKGNIIGASKIARDITARKEIERQKKLFTEKLQELNIFKDEFMAMASHELKTPLTVVKANLQVLEHIVTTDQQKGFLDKAFAHLDRLSNLISDLLDVSRIQGGSLELHVSRVDVVELFKSNINLIQAVAKDHVIHFTSTKDHIFITADKDRLEQVISNMLTNAIKYSPYAKKVEAGITADSNEVTAYVKDWGIGIPKDDLKNIFSRFYRVRGLASTFSGSGIGLYISHEIVKRHGGEMWAESNIGEGTTFYFRLPIKKRRVQKATKSGVTF